MLTALIPKLRRHLHPLGRAGESKSPTATHPGLANWIFHPPWWPARSARANPLLLPLSHGLALCENLLSFSSALALAHFLLPRLFTPCIPTNASFTNPSPTNASCDSLSRLHFTSHSPLPTCLSPYCLILSNKPNRTIQSRKRFSLVLDDSKAHRHPAFCLTNHLTHPFRPHLHA